jgi:hypothetical protein
MGGRQGAYVMLEDVAGDEGFVDARVFVGSEVLQGIFGDALMPRGFCAINHGQWNAPSWVVKGAYLCSAAWRVNV